MNKELLDRLVNNIIQNGRLEVEVPKTLPKFWIDVHKKLGEDMETVAIISALTLVWSTTLVGCYKKDGLDADQIQEKMDEILNVAGDTVNVFVTAMIKERVEAMEEGDNETAH